MYVNGTFQTEEIVADTPLYELFGKADVVMQNTGTADVKVGIRTIKPNGFIRLCGELTILNNKHIPIIFQGAGTKQVWVHFIAPDNGCLNS